MGENENKNTFVHGQFLPFLAKKCQKYQLLNSVAVAVAVQLATEMALNSEIVCSFGRSVVTLFGNPNKATAIAIAIAI